MKFENLEDMSKCPGLIFQQNVLGLTNKQKKKNYRSVFGKKRREKTVKRKISEFRRK